MLDWPDGWGIYPRWLFPAGCRNLGGYSATSPGRPTRRPARSPAATGWTAGSSPRPSPSPGPAATGRGPGWTPRPGWSSCWPASRTTRRPRRRSSTSGRPRLTDGERASCATFYLDGLGEFAYRNEPRPVRPARSRPTDRTARGRSPAGGPPSRRGRWCPFGGGIDSIVTVELLRGARRRRRRCSWSTGRATGSTRSRTPAGVTGLPVVRAERLLDEQVLRSRELGFLNGHVPVTGDHLGHRRAGRGPRRPRRGRDVQRVVGVVGNARVDGRVVNHQWSKSARVRGPRSAPSLAAAVGRGRRVLLAGCGRSPSSGSPSGSPRSRQYHAHVPQLQPGVPHRPRPPARPLVRRVRQVLLHRPDPGAVPARDELRRDLRRAAEPLANPALPTQFRALLGARPGRQAVRVRRRRRRVPGRRRCWPRGARRPGRRPAAPGPGRRGRRRPDARRRRRGLLRPLGDHFIPAVPDRLCARRSPGLTCRGAPGRRLGPGHRGPGQRAQLPVARRRAGARRRPARRDRRPAGARRPATAGSTPC